MIVHRGDQVFGLDTGFVRTAARRHVHDVSAIRGQTELSGGFLVVVLHGDTHVSAGDVAVVDQVGDNAHHVVNGDGKADALDGRAGVGGAGIFGGGNADDLAVHIEQRAAGVARIDGRIGLEHTDDGVVGGDLPVDAADIAHGLRGSQTAKRIADGDYHVADGKIAAAADGRGGQSLGFHLQNGHVVGGVVALHRGGILVAAVGGDGDIACILHNVVVGHHVAVLRQDEAGTGGRSLHALAVGGGLHGAGNGHHAVNVALIQLRRSHGRTVRCRERAGCTARGRSAVDLLLQVVDLPAQLLGDLVGFLLPSAVDGGSRDQAAGSHQRHNKNGGDNGLPGRLAGSTGLFLPLLGRLRLGLVLILIRPGLAGHIGGIGVGRLPAARTGGVIGAGLGFALALLRDFISWFLRSFVLRLLRGVETRFGSRVIFFRIFAICKGVHGGYLLLFSYPTLSVTYEEICIDM